jgi:lipoprotein-anchoring transpeptidase ErfK/SrfK
MKRLLLSVILLGYAGVAMAEGQVSGGVEQVQSAEKAWLNVRQAEAAAQASAAQNKGVASDAALEAVSQAHLAFLDASTPEQNALVYGDDSEKSLVQSADFDPENNVLDMLHDVSSVSRMSCSPDSRADVIINVHTSATPFNASNPAAGGQYLVASYPNGAGLGPIPISSAGMNRDKKGKIRLFKTPTGCYHGVLPMEHASSASYGNSPMPDALFFIGHIYAIHGTMEESELGHRASHGCVRIARANAKALFAEVAKVGASNTYIIIQ